MSVSIVDKLNSISNEMDSLLDFIASNEILGEDFEIYVEENNIKIERQAQLNIALVEYLLDGKMQDGTRVLDYYFNENPNCNKSVIEALKSSVTSVFEIKKVLKNAYETYSLTADREFCLIPLVKMVNLRGISRGDYICARAIEYENEFYILEIYEVISSLNFFKAGSRAIKCMISSPKSAVFKNDEKKELLKNSLSEFKKTFDINFENYDKCKIITTNKLADQLITTLSENKDPKEFIEEPSEYKFFEIDEFKNANENDFVQNAIGGFSNHKKTYDVGLFFDETQGLYIVPFLGTFYKIFENEEIEGRNECVREFLKSDKVPYGVIEYCARVYTNFLEVVNSCLGTNFNSTIEVLEKFKGKKQDNEGIFSPTLILYNSKIFSELLGFCEQENKQEVQSVGRNEPCPCGSGKKFKHCCQKN